MISPETIALVKERTDLVAIIGESVKLTRRGRSFVGLCPFHKEKTPSFHVNAERGFFHCFGCKESGGAIDFVMKLEGYSFPEAVRVLAERSGIEVVDTATDAERREATAARRTKDDLYNVNNLAALYFERCLRGGNGAAGPHPLAHYARAELARRGLSLPSWSADDAGDGHDNVGEAARLADTLQAFRIGYAPFGWDGLATFLKQNGVSPMQAERVGLLVPRQSGTGHYDRFRHRLMFAVVDVMGRVIAFSGRALPEPSPDELVAAGLSGPSHMARGQQDNAAPAKYINSPESPIYTKGEHLFGLYQARQAIRQEGLAVLVEGNFDVVALHARGVSNVIAPLGTAFTAAQAKLIRRFASDVVLLFDGDAAGRKATRAARGPCREGGLSAKVARLPDGIDPDDFVRKNGAEALSRVIKGAREIREYLIDDLLEGDGFRGASASEQLNRVRAVAQLLAEEDDPNLRQMLKTYADRLSSKLVLRGSALASLRDLEVALEQALLGGPRRPPPLAPSQSAAPYDRARSRAQVDEIALNALGALFDFPALAEDPEVEEALSVLDGDAALTVAALRQRLSQVRDQDLIGGSPYANIEPAPSGSIGGGLSNNRIYADEFLAQIPASIHPFATGRLASPVFDVVDDARHELLENARKLKRLSLLRENAAAVDLPNRVEAQGDIDSVNAQLLEIAQRAKAKLGLS